MESKQIHNTIIKDKMKKAGYVLLILCFIWSIAYSFGMKGEFEIIKFWVNIGMIMIFGHTTKHIVNNKINSKENLNE